MILKKKANNNFYMLLTTIFGRTKKSLFFFYVEDPRIQEIYCHSLLCIVENIIQILLATRIVVHKINSLHMNILWPNIYTAT